MKEKIKRLFASIAAILMAIGLVGANAVPVMADGNNDGTITINNPVANEHYDVYKVFDAVPDNAENPSSVSYTYTKKGGTDAFLTALQGSTSPFTVTQVGTSNEYTVVWKSTDPEQTDTQKQEAVTSFLNAQKDNLGDAVKKIKPVTSADVTADTGYTNEVITAAAGESAPAHITLTGLDYGYYYITTTTGSAVLINSAAKNVTINEKNTVPSIDKKQGLSNNDNVTYSDDPVHVNIGDTIYYQINVTVGKNNGTNYTITDTLSPGLSLNVTTREETAQETVAGGTIKIGDKALPTDAYTWTTTPDGNTRIQGFTIIINGTYLKDHADAVITIQYSARLNPNAVINNVTNKNTNTAKLEYSHQTVTDHTDAYTYDFNLKKSDASNSNTYIAGAEFKLYDAETAGTQIKVAHDSMGYYVNTSADLNADTTVISVDNANGVNIRGLKPGTYYLEETKAPAGYDRQTGRLSVTVSENQTQSAEINVPNTKGSLLPSTGGIGTTIFYIAGGILIIGAAVLLIARRKRNA